MIAHTPLTGADLAELQVIIRDHHAALAIEMFGVDAAGLDADEIKRLVDLGILDPGATGAMAHDLVGDAFAFGQLQAHLRHGAERVEGERDDLSTWSYGRLRDRLQRDPIAVTASQSAAAEVARRDAAWRCHGLGNVVARDTGQVVVDADATLRLEMERAIREETETAILERKTAQQLKSELGHRTGDWSRDWDRIARTELQDAYNEGEADQVEQDFGAEQTVFRTPNPDACKQCRRLLLQDGAPRTFTLAELRANGNNYGRKQADWQPGIGTIHPNCHCGPPTPLPDGFRVNKRGSIVSS